MSVSAGSGSPITISISAVVTLTAATIFTLQVNDQSTTGGLLIATGDVVANKATSITAIRLS